jgi:flagellar motor switch protein FliM
VSDLLSQDEVDALLKAVGEGTLGAEPMPAAGVVGGMASGVRALDLTNQERSLHGRLPGLEIVIGRLTRALRGSLATFFGSVPEVHASVVELIKFGGFMARLPQPVGLQFFKLAPLRGQGMLVVRQQLLADVLQVLFGGTPGRKAPALAREFSAIETRVLERLGQRVLADVREAWRPVVPIECTFLRTETNPVFAAIAAAHELVLHVELAVQPEGHDELSIAFCIPNGALDPVRVQLGKLQAAGEQEDPIADAGWHRRLEAALGEAPIPLVGELGSRRMTMRAVLALQVGDVVALGTGREGPVRLRVAGRTHFLGAPGVSGSNNAVRITARS